MKWAFLTLGVLHNEGISLFLKVEWQKAMEVGICRVFVFEEKAEYISYPNVRASPSKTLFLHFKCETLSADSFQCWRRVKWVSSVSDHPSVPESILASVYSSFSKPRYSTFQRLRYKISRHCVVIHPRKPIVSQFCAMFCVLCGTQAAHSRNIALKLDIQMDYFSVQI